MKLLSGDEGDFACSRTCIGSWAHSTSSPCSSPWWGL